MRRTISLTAATVLAGFLAGPAVAGDGLHVSDAYARVAGASARSGAAFMVIENHGAEADRLVAAESDVAERVELHTHAEDAQGVMRMVEVEGGIEVPAGGRALLERGGYHVMFLGLTRNLAHGDRVQVTLTFERGGKVELEVPVDLERRPAAGHGGGHGQGHGHGHGQGGHGHGQGQD